MKNMGFADRMIRMILAAVIITLMITGIFQNAIAWIGGILAFILIATSLVGVCPLYRILGISTFRKKESSDQK